MTKYIHNNGYLEPVPRVEKPPMRFGRLDRYREAVLQGKWNDYKTWLAARIPCAPGTTWEDREYSDNEFDVKECDCTGLGQKYDHCDIFSPCSVAYPLPVVEEKKCTHQTLKSIMDTIDRHLLICKACDRSWTLSEWQSEGKPTDPLDIPRFTARDMIGAYDSGLSSGALWRDDELLSKIRTERRNYFASKGITKLPDNE